MYRQLSFSSLPHFLLLPTSIFSIALPCHHTTTSASLDSHSNTLKSRSARHISNPACIHLFQSFNDMSINPSLELKLLFEAALNEFGKRTGTNLVQHQIINKLVNCESTDSVIGVFRDQAQAIRNFRGDDGKLMTWLKRTVNVLRTLSTSDVLGAISFVRVDC